MITNYKHHRSKKGKFEERGIDLVIKDWNKNKDPYGIFVGKRTNK